MSKRELAKIEYAKAVAALPEIQAELGSEEECQLLVLRYFANRETIDCRYCQHPNNFAENLERKFLCELCRKEIWITARTQFDHARNFSARLILISLVERKIILNPNQAHILLGVSTHFVDQFYKKLGLSATEIMDANCREIQSQEFVEIMMRRSIETPAGKAAAEEETAFQNQLNFESSNMFPQSDQSENASLSELEIDILSQITVQPISMDKLQKASVSTADVSAAITMLELSGLVEKLPGHRFVLASRTLVVSTTSAESNHSASMLITFVKEFSQGISRKYLQIYGALHWLFFDKERWGIGTLLPFCLTTSDLSRKEILNYVTPLKIKMMTGYDTS